MTTGRAGLFVTLEGGEGAGKSTLARRLAADLEARGHAVKLTREPGGSAGADAIRALLVRGDADRWSPLAETLLFAAARTDHLERTIRPALAAGRVVICDRYLDSTFAYQVAGHGLAQATFDAVAAATAPERPDLTLVLDLPPEAGLSRSRGGAVGEDRFERLDAAFHARVRTAFLDIAAREPARCRVLDATHPAEAIAAAALAHVTERLS
ncbi:MAG: dTMP kinase [Alphaproteobacteria bacterium]|nr:dTMP kinase [Alphaproteobacteria bacterium]